MNNNLAPIVLFVYNRPWHTEQTLNALMQNEQASESTLYIYCDGGKVDATEEQKQNIIEVGKVVRKKQWCKEVFIIVSKQNKGLANSIISGVTEVIDKHGKVIVLEDDLITSMFFLKYMNNALNYYQNRKTVFSISADRPLYNHFQIPKDYEYDVFVSLRFYSYGWATWIDRWKSVDWTLDFIVDYLNKPWQIEAFNRGGEDLNKMLIMQLNHKIDSWAIRFVFAHYVNHAVAILPCVSYIDNIGCDGSGIHSGYKGLQYRKNISDAIRNPIFLDVLYEDKRIINSFYSAYYPKKRPFWKKIINRLCRIVGRKNVFFIKKKVYN